MKNLPAIKIAALSRKDSSLTADGRVEHLRKPLRFNDEKRNYDPRKVGA